MLLVGTSTIPKPSPGTTARRPNARLARFIETKSLRTARIAEMNALDEGLPVPPANPIMARLLVAASRDADVFRGMLEIAMCVALPQEVIARRHVAARLAELDGQPMPPTPGIIDRHRMAALLDG
jgi:hypothetical protein